MMNTLEKSILYESIKIPNLQTLNKSALNDKMIEILEKVSKENQIPVSAIEEVFRNQEKNERLFLLLSGRKNDERIEEKESVEKKRNGLKR